jgi:hypothetical protein
MTERFEDILAKKEEACVKRYDVKEENKAERFNIFIRRPRRRSTSKRRSPSSKRRRRTSRRRRPSSKKGGLSLRPLRKKTKC